jgi:hypothetical protein
MTFTTDQYSQIARGYDKAAADPFVPKDKREEFAKKAEWFHYLSAREKETEAVAYGGSEEASSERPRRSVGARLRQKPPSKVAQPRPSEPSSPRPAPGYAELPDDEDFFADRATRRKGLFARRRMLREGLMSPGFLPPQ